jgi:signal transduction histidine kinase
MVAGTEVVRSLPGFFAPELLASLLLAGGYALIAAALRKGLGPLPRIGTRGTYLVFLSIAVLGAALNTAMYVGTLSLLGFAANDRLGAAFKRAWIGDVVSLVVMLPVMFSLIDPLRRAAAAAMLRSTEWWLIALAACAAAVGVFAQPVDAQFKLFYLFFLPVAWAAARFGNPGAVWSTALVQALLIAAVQASPYRPVTVFELHMVMAALGATALLLGATVDEREQAEQALRESLHAAAAADMAAALAHELNQPLTAMRGYARACQWLAQQQAAGQPAPALPEVSAKLVDEVARAGAVVRRLRDFFRQGQTELQFVPLLPLLHDTLAAQQARAQAADVTLTLQAEPDLPALWMDPVQIGVVLRNLVANAVDAAAGLPHGEVRLRLQRQGDDLLLSVSDNGPGVPADELPRLFDARTSRKPQGMGIGLAISRSIVQAHDGRLWAEAGPGGRFHLALPLQGEDEHG